MMTSDFKRICRCLGSGIQPELVDVDPLWKLAMDGVDNMFPDMTEQTGMVNTGPGIPSLSGARRSFEINRRVVDAINLLFYGTFSENDPLDPPESLRVDDYDEWVSENENLIAQYQAMNYSFIEPSEILGVTIFRRPGGSLYCIVEGKEYNLSANP